MRKSRGFTDRFPSLPPGCTPSDVDEAMGATHDHDFGHEPEVTLFEDGAVIEHYRCHAYLGSSHPDAGPRCDEAYHKRYDCTRVEVKDGVSWLTLAEADESVWWDDDPHTAPYVDLTYLVETLDTIIDSEITEGTDHEITDYSTANVGVSYGDGEYTITVEHDPNTYRMTYR